MRLRLAVSMLATAASLGLAADAPAEFYVAAPADKLAEFEIANNDNPQGVFMRGYIGGPRVVVRGQSANRDGYQCAEPNADRAELINNWIVLPDNLATADLSYTSTSTLVPGAYNGSYTTVYTWNWTDIPVYIRVLIGCTNSTSFFPPPFSYGDYYDQYIASLRAGRPDYRCVALNAFQFRSCAPTAFARASAATPPAARRTPAISPGGTTFPIADGDNTLALTFRQPRGSRRPPAIYLKTRPANADCAAQRMHVPVNDGRGYVRLGLRCRGLKAGATARLRIGPSIRRSFRLSRGRGTGRVRLDKPPGSVKPLVYVDTHPVKLPCSIRSRQVRMTRSELDLRIDGHCGVVPRGSVGQLHVGGLLAEDRPPSR